MSIAQDTRGLLSKMTERPSLIRDLEAGYVGRSRPSVQSRALLSVFASGSAVIASQERLAAVAQQHRKVGAIDMEAFGFHRAVELSGHKVHVFTAKVIVDSADSKKSDDLHQYGCYLSAHMPCCSSIRPLGTSRTT